MQPNTTPTHTNFKAVPLRPETNRKISELLKSLQLPAFMTERGIHARQNIYKLFASNIWRKSSLLPVPTPDAILVPKEKERCHILPVACQA